MSGGGKSISIHALREEGDPHSIGAKAKINNISIHALREEGDACSVWRQTGFINFNPRPPRGGRLTSAILIPILGEFQSTPSARRATDRPHNCKRYVDISIHALREEGDLTVLQPTI